MRGGLCACMHACLYVCVCGEQERGVEDKSKPPTPAVPKSRCEMCLLTSSRPWRAADRRGRAYAAVACAGREGQLVSSFPGLRCDAKRQGNTSRGSASRVPPPPPAASTICPLSLAVNHMPLGRRYSLWKLVQAQPTGGVGWIGVRLILGRGTERWA